MDAYRKYIHTHTRTAGACCGLILINDSTFTPLVFVARVEEDSMCGIRCTRMCTCVLCTRKGIENQISLPFRSRAKQSACTSFGRYEAHAGHMRRCTFDHQSFVAKKLCAAGNL